MTVTVRFAPSPTGRIHVGNVRTALLNWLFARAAGGGFLLRLDDTDRERSTEEFARGIERDLEWLGLSHDDFMRQSDRMARYDEVRDLLIAGGRLYPCYETADELERKRKRQLARGLPPVYDRAALKLTAEEKAAFEAEGRTPHWRFLLDQEATGWADMIRGDVNIDAASLSDPVLIRADGTYLYTLCSVVDDVDKKITHVIRGEDHVANTGVQIQIFRALGAEPPAFGHHPLLVNADGGPLSKRLGSLSIASMREEGVEPMALLSLLAKLGTSDAVEVRGDLATLIAEFDIGKIGRAPARFDMRELEALNAKLLSETPYAEVAERLERMGVLGGVAFWETVRENITRIDGVLDWWAVVNEPVTPQIAEEDREFLALAASLLPETPWDQETWGALTGALKAKTGRKGKALFLPLRKALTGREAGPEMHRLLPLIEQDRARARLHGRTA